jgi:hypothetical protein
MLTVKLVEGVLNILVDGKYPVYKGENAWEIYDRLETKDILFFRYEEGHLFRLKWHINNML